MKKLLSILVVVAVCTILVTFLISFVTLVGLGAGYCLHWLVPAIDLGAATIIGVLAFLTVTFIVLKVFQLAAFASPPHIADAEDEEEVEEILSEEQVDLMADQLSEAVLMKIGRWPGKQRGRSRSQR